ncbi:MAG: hypothetical protein BGO98_19025 [Myxococcales bacterium 68-20]|nr:MAG: hypothetical protein BGO98_19025 [Myxococcales bacterium 68-20]
MRKTLVRAGATFSGSGETLALVTAGNSWAAVLVGKASSSYGSGGARSRADTDRGVTEGRRSAMRRRQVRVCGCPSLSKAWPSWCGVLTLGVAPFPVA